MEPVPGVIGQSRNGLIVPIEREQTAKRFDVRHLERFELGRSYPSMVTDVVTLLGREPLCSASVTLIIDRTGVGRAVSDMFEQANLSCNVVPVSIHGGDRESRDGAAWNVPKRDVIGAAQAALQQGRLKIAAVLPLAAVLTRELADYRVRISQSGHDSYDAREGQHDDLLLSLALVCWYGTESGQTEFFW
jgi:hypothetical protein